MKFLTVLVTVMAFATVASAGSWPDTGGGSGGSGVAGTKLDATSGPIIASVSTATCASGWYIDVDRGGSKTAGTDPCVKGQEYTDATDCTSLTGGVVGDVCWEKDSNEIFVCEPTDADGCNAPGEWFATTPLTDTAGVIHPSTATDDIGNDATGTNWLITDTGAATFEGGVTAGANTNPADTGAINLDNGGTICWESSPAGADNCIYVDSNETLQLPMMAPPRSAAGPVTCAAAFEGTIYYDTTLSMMCVCSDRSTAYIWESFDNTVEGNNADCG